MKKNSIPKLIMTLGAAFALTLTSVPAIAAPPEKPDGTSSGTGGGPGGSAPGSNASVSYSGATTISSDTATDAQAYDSVSGGENALLVSDGTSVINNPLITKSGSPSGGADQYDFYGTNAAVLVYNGAKLTINDGSVETNASYANGVFAYGTGNVTLKGTIIHTTSNNSGALMVTGGGTLTAENVNATTEGNSSAAIRSDRGGGTLTVNGGSYTSNGTGSPAIYSTADIIVNNASLTATHSEGVVVEGANSVTLNNTRLTDTNDKLNGQSKTYKNIFLYQSMSGDASEGTASFTAKDSELVSYKGDTFFVTNTTAKINLSGNTIVNHDADGAFLRAEAAAWGNTGSNGGKVTLMLDDQTVSGDMIADSISTVDVNMKNGSEYTGTINGNGNAKQFTLTLDAKSSLVLTGDSYVTELVNEDSTNSNIHLNGYHLYVNGTAVSADSSGVPTAQEETTEKPADEKRDETADETAGGEETSFSDVLAESYYAEPVAWALGKGITSGIGGNLFGPDQTCTRAQIVTFLHRAAGKPSANGTDLFTDVKAGDYYRDAVLWAAREGITGGTGGNLFSPDASCTRAQAITFMYRAAGSPAVSGENPFNDVEEGSYYRDAVLWAVANGITEGTGSNTFSPDAPCSRAQIVTFLYRGKSN